MKALLAIVTLVLVLAAPDARAEDGRAQMCWAVGRFDSTVYFAEIEEREDRAASFAELLEISGIDNFGVHCAWQDACMHREFKRRMIDNWHGLELEVINTTFMSDLDY